MKVLRTFIQIFAPFRPEHRITTTAPIPMPRMRRLPRGYCARHADEALVERSGHKI